ncbi:MAG: hypothetical protein V3574_02990 [Candidatus Moraniibacteriota bacterium]
MLKIKKIIQSIKNDKREIYRIHIAHSIRSISLSFITIYAPIYLLRNGFSLEKTIHFYTIFHIFGLLVTLFFLVPMMKKIGLSRIFRLYYPLEMAYYAFLFFMQSLGIPFWLVAMIGGAATFIYWVPLNILLVRHSDFDKMGTDLATFFALPKMLQVFNPLISLALIYSLGFWSIFSIVILGLVASYIPLYKIKSQESKLNLNWKNFWIKFKKRKSLFFLESLDNIIEESHWFWSIYVYLILGSLVAPGIVGTLSSLGGIIFMFLVGKKSNGKPEKLIVWASALMILISFLRIYIVDQYLAYGLTLVGSFAMTFLLVPYFSYIYKSIKDKDEEEFIILREIPTVFGRLIVFGFILLTISHPNLFFLLPLAISFLLLVIFVMRKKFSFLGVAG